MEDISEYHVLYIVLHGRSSVLVFCRKHVINNGESGEVQLMTSQKEQIGIEIPDFFIFVCLISGLVVLFISCVLRWKKRYHGIFRCENILGYSKYFVKIRNA